MKKILLVDDDLGCLKNIAAFLRGESYEVTEARDGDEALDLLTHSKFDLILTDIRMPKIDGVSLSERARAISPTLPVILMTAFETRATRKDTISLHADDFLFKPLILAQLLETIRRAIAGSARPRSPNRLN